MVVALLVTSTAAMEPSDYASQRGTQDEDIFVLGPLSVRYIRGQTTQ
jgi:hypothetical protein